MSALPETTEARLLPAPRPGEAIDAEVVRSPHLRLVTPQAPQAPAPLPALSPRLSVVIPATDGPATLDRCLRAIKAAEDAPSEIIVLHSPARQPQATARNRGAHLATGDVLVFIDADVEVHPDVFRRIRRLLADEPNVTALFGSYDDDPGGEGVVSQFRNLLHHHVHQGSPGAVGTFWAGLGAIRRDAFLATGGFIQHPIEDVELGMRIAADGAAIVLDPRIQGKHLKRWTLANMVKTDLLVRGAPWIGLSLTHRRQPASLNMGWRHRVSAAASLCTLAALLFRRPRTGAGSLAVIVGLNRSFYGLLLRRRGLGSALAGVLLHVVHHLTGVAALPMGVAMYARHRKDAPCALDSSD